MPEITIVVSDDTAVALAELVRLCTEANRERDGATTHGALTAPGLLAMLVQDAAMALTRPGSWEDAGMTQPLASHGYEVW